MSCGGTCGDACASCQSEAADVSGGEFRIQFPQPPRWQWRRYNNRPGYYDQYGRRLCDNGETPQPAEVRFRGRLVANKTCECGGADTPCRQREAAAEAARRAPPPPRPAAAPAPAPAPARPRPKFRFHPSMFRLMRRIPLTPKTPQKAPPAAASSRELGGPNVSDSSDAEPTEAQRADALAFLESLSAEMEAAGVEELPPELAEAVAEALEILEFAGVLEHGAKSENSAVSGAEIGDVWQDIARGAQAVDQALDPILDKVLPAVPFVGPAVQMAHRARVDAMYGARRPAAPAARPRAPLAPPRSAPAVDHSGELAELRALVMRARAKDPGAQATVARIRDGAERGDLSSRRRWRAVLYLVDATQ